ncbi:type IV pilus modification protein PilV [Microbulbifer echini]|uniref:Type IV pilus modification protein PilV n=1 Tax=Microbulbifer echini TaxID=1529067 RepID=A0ABV4NQJ2_9GAMM|nr:type IV pilus modification protein PilV [uncultured Microbulbifer sp.]
MFDQRGATLIEILVSILVLAIGLLGLAATQMMSLKNGNGSHHRYMAALAAQEIIERMRANPVGFKSGDYDGNHGLSVDLAGEDDDISGGAPSTDNNSLTPDCSSKCTPSELSDLDIYEWENLLSSNFPSATGSIKSDAGEVKVTITWKEQHTGKSYGGSSGNLDDATFEMSVEL